MQPKSRRWLEDIIISCDFILSAARYKTLADYESDGMLRAAVERHFEIIGEAMNRILRHDPDTAALVGEHRRIIAFRNVLAHGYDLVNKADVWKIIQTDLPVLRAQVAELLKGAKG